MTPLQLIDIPPYVLAGEPPPSRHGWERAFHTRSYLVPPPVDFPRELFAEALAGHVRLLEEHAADILAAPLEEPRGDTEGAGDDERNDEHAACNTLDAIDLTASLLVSEGSACAIYKWRAQEVSYVVQRCRGIVRRLMEAPADGTTYVVVVARGVASLHHLRGVEPRRAGDPERLERMGEALAVEPWDQWHRRYPGSELTWWRTPAGDPVVSRVRLPPRPRTPREVVAALVALYEPSVRRGLAEYRRQNPRRRGLAIIVSSPAGEDLHFVDRFEGDAWVDGFPAILAAVGEVHRGFDPVIVDTYTYAGLHWLPREEAARDGAVPPPLIEMADDDDDDDDELSFLPRPRPRPRRPPRPKLGMLAVFLGCYVAIGPLVLILAHMPTAQRWLEGILSLAAVLLAAGAIASCWHAMGTLLRLAEYLHCKRQWRLHTPPRAAEPRPAEETPEYWMSKLAARLERRQRLVDLKAPDTIIENEQELIRKAMANLSPQDALAVMSAWQHLTPRARE